VKLLALTLELRVSLTGQPEGENDDTFPVLDNDPRSFACLAYLGMGYRLCAALG
jgi:hypothetical protein